MSNLSEEEIIDKVEILIEYGLAGSISEKDIEILQGLLDLYNKEKEKNKELKENLIFRVNYCKKLEQELYGGDFELTISEQKEFVSKDKIEKKIEELENKYKDKVKTAQDYDTNQFIVDCVAVLEELLEE